MGYRSFIENIKLKDKEFYIIANKLKENGIETKFIFKLRKDINVYMIKLKEKGFIRLDIFNKKRVSKLNFLYQNLAYDNNVNVPKIFSIIEYDNEIWKISQWITGTRTDKVWNYSKVFIQFGKEIAKLNLIKDSSSDTNLAYFDLSKINQIWSRNKDLYIIDVNFGLVKNVDKYVVKNLIMGLRTKNRIQLFLEGYQQYRSTNRILKLLNKSQWKWRDFGLKKDDVLI